MLTSATGLTGVIVVELLSVGSGSTVPDGGVIEAVLLNVPVAEPDTVPLIVIVTEPPEGSVGIVALTLLPLIVIALGQTAPPLAVPQLAANPVMLAVTASATVLPSAALGPALVMTKL
jgi:hypothetical protein